MLSVDTVEGHESPELVGLGTMEDLPPALDPFAHEPPADVDALSAPLRLPPLPPEDEFESWLLESWRIYFAAAMSAAGRNLFAGAAADANTLQACAVVADQALEVERSKLAAWHRERAKRRRAPAAAMAKREALEGVPF